MALYLNQFDDVLSRATPDICPAAQLVVRWQGRTRLERAFGWLDPDSCLHPTTTKTRFDLASVTKLFTVTTFMTLVEAGQLSLDQPVSTVLPDFSGIRSIRPYENPLAPGEFISVADGGTDVDADRITFRHLLTHTSGLPAWRPLYQQPDAEAAHDMALTTFFACQPGDHVIYSDIGLILIGLAIQRVTGQRLNCAMHDRLLAPLGLEQTGYITVDDDNVAPNWTKNIAPTEYCVWRQRRMVGQVHDENAYRLRGIAGHAGLFSTAVEVAVLGQMYLNGGRPLLSAETVAEMTRLQVSEGNVRRGLGFVLWTSDPEAKESCFSATAFGHTGFTGTSLWIDPARDLVVVLLTNEVYHGRIDRKIAQLRLDVHSATVAAIDAMERPS